MRAKTDEMAELIEINAEASWKCKFRCRYCYRFFECPSPRKYEFYDDSRVKAIAKNLSNVQDILLVTSGKGGVGKSVISANLAVALAHKGYTCAIVDCDWYGPSVPGILGVEGLRLKSGPRGMVPPRGPLGIKVVSNAFVTGDDEATTWLTDAKMEGIELFLANSDFGYLDYLVMDLPPGTGSEIVNLIRLLPRISGAIAVTTPSEVANQVVRRGISLCQRAQVPTIGLIENMSGHVCPDCGKVIRPGSGLGERLAQETGIPFLGKIARDPLVVDAADKGKSFLLEYPNAEATRSLLSIVDQILVRMGSEHPKLSVPSHVDSEEEAGLDIVRINVQDSCYGETCQNCSRYFQCTLLKKEDIHGHLRFKNLKSAMGGIKHKVAVMSGKGGVGKSTLTANLGVCLARKGKKVCILDCDLHGPSIPKILGVEDKRMKIGERGIVPVATAFNVDVVSVGFLAHQDKPVTWFDLLKKATVEQLLSTVNYGELDYLVIDLPPGTGPESYSVLQFITALDGVVLVTLPSHGSRSVVRRSTQLCRQANVLILGIVNNMGNFVCPGCKKVLKLSGSEDLREFSKNYGIPVLGEIPLDNSITETCDGGVPFVVAYPESIAGRSISEIADRVEETVTKPGNQG
jgi:ATP-binding protein involved in chromosome partitioning